MTIVAVRGNRARDRRSDEFDLLDLVITVAGRGRDLDLLAHRAADQRPPERRIVADPADLRVGLGLADELVALPSSCPRRSASRSRRTRPCRPTASSGRSPSRGSAGPQGRRSSPRPGPGAPWPHDIRRSRRGRRARALPRSPRRSRAARPLQPPQLVVELAVTLGQHRHFFGTRHYSKPFFKDLPGRAAFSALSRAECRGSSLVKRRNNRTGATRLQARVLEPPRSTAPRRRLAAAREIGHLAIERQ